MDKIKTSRRRAASAKKSAIQDLPANKSEIARPKIVQAGAGEERDHLHDLFMQAPAMIVILNGPDHVIELANPMYRQLIGRGEDIIGKPLKKALPDIADQYIELLDRVFKSGEPFVGNEIPAKIGRSGNGKTEEIFCNFVYQPYRDAKGRVEGIFAHGVDVTGQVLARKKAEDAEARHRTMFEQSPLSVQIMSPDGYTLQVNKAWEELWGATLDQLKGYNMLEDKQLVKLGIMPYIKKGFNGEPTLIPAVKYEPDKTIPDISKIPYKWVRAFIYPVRDTSGTIREVVLVHEDITVQKKAESALHESESRFRFMAESMPQKIFTATPAGDVDYFNPQWMEFTGLSFEQIRDWGWTQFIHPDDVDENVARWQHSIKTGEPFVFEHRFRRHDGKYRWHISRAHAMRDDQGNIVKWVGSNTDIHDIRLALQRERDLKLKAASLTEQRAQLVALNNAKDEFISLASHQLRTPATGVKQFLGMVLEGGFTDTDLSDEHRALLELAYDSNERQLQVINDLLKVARVDAGNIILKKQKVDFVPLIHDILAEQAEAFRRRNQKVTFTHKAKSYMTEADEAKIRMVLENVIDNATKYTMPGKKIDVHLAKRRGFIEIAVKDEGVGVAQDDIDKMFDKFTRVDNSLSIEVGGTGVGLYWAKKIVDLHDGNIHVTSEPGKGTTFVVSLPIS